MNENQGRPRSMMMLYIIFLLSSFYLFSWLQGLFFSLFTQLSPLSLVMMTAPYVLGMLFLALGSRIAFKTTLFTRPRPLLFFLIFIAFFCILAILALFKDLRPSEMKSSLSWIAASLLFTSIQVLFEESLFRMALSRIEGNELPEHAIAYSLLSGLAFTAAHLSNPEAIDVQALAFYFSMGFVLMYLSLKAKGFEPALAIHLANNLFVDLVVGYEGPMLKRPLYLQPDPTKSLLADTLISLTLITILTLLFLRRSPYAKEEKKA
ncbi:MAG: type II CAAX endopeptidase family protein [Sphaerochaetaceae bacterium]|nr:type II CAAX endopeptidase family protein [Sphaerochaetaceae bacterium]